jgi:hypothetical protein
VKPPTLVYEVKMKSASGADMGTRKMTMSGSNFVWEAHTNGLKIVFVKNADGAF